MKRICFSYDVITLACTLFAWCHYSSASGYTMKPINVGETDMTVATGDPCAHELQALQNAEQKLKQAEANYKSAKDKLAKVENNFAKETDNFNRIAKTLGLHGQADPSGSMTFGQSANDDPFTRNPEYLAAKKKWEEAKAKHDKDKMQAEGEGDAAGIERSKARDEYEEAKVAYERCKTAITSPEMGKLKEEEARIKKAISETEKLISQAPKPEDKKKGEEWKKKLEEDLKKKKQQIERESLLCQDPEVQKARRKVAQLEAEQKEVYEAYKKAEQAYKDYGSGIEFGTNRYKERKKELGDEFVKKSNDLKAKEKELGAAREELRKAEIQIP